MSERQTSVPSDAAQLPELSQFLRDFWTEFNLPASEVLAFELALEEVFMNVVMHGSVAAEAPSVNVSLTWLDSGVTLTVEDDGAPFDPLSLPAPDVTASLERRPVGGLGVFLVRQIMDSVVYERRGTMNQLRMRKSVTRTDSPHV